MWVWLCSPQPQVVHIFRSPSRASRIGEAHKNFVYAFILGVSRIPRPQPQGPLQLSIGTRRTSPKGIRLQDTYRFWRPASWPENRTRPESPASPVPQGSAAAAGPHRPSSTRRSPSRNLRRYPARTRGEVVRPLGDRTRGLLPRRTTAHARHGRNRRLDIRHGRSPLARHDGRLGRGSRDREGRPLMRKPKYFLHSH